MTDEYRNLREAREAEEARRTPDDDLSELQKVWKESTEPYRSALEFDQHEPRSDGSRGVDGAKVYAQVAALLAEVQRLREENAELSEENARLQEQFYRAHEQGFRP